MSSPRSAASAGSSTAVCGPRTIAVRPASSAVLGASAGPQRAPPGCRGNYNKVRISIGGLDGACMKIEK